MADDARVGTASPDSVEDATRRNIELIRRLDQAAAAHAGPADRAAAQLGLQVFEEAMRPEKLPEQIEQANRRAQ